jgi:Raf kinase inhibitor-like YbhB/YbcL family protein
MKKQPIKVTTSAFAEGQAIPRKYTGEGEDRSPPLTWLQMPAETKEVALICSDPDAPVGTWHHWVLYGLPPTTSELLEGIAREATLKNPAGAKQGFNSWPGDNVGYRGPMPPKGHGPHRYIFTVYALDQPLSIRPEEATAERLLAAMEGHILAEGHVMGKYERK